MCKCPPALCLKGEARVLPQQLAGGTAASWYLCEIQKTYPQRWGALLAEWSISWTTAPLCPLCCASLCMIALGDERKDEGRCQ